MSFATSSNELTENKGIEYFPNPVSDVLNLEFEQSFTGQLTVVSATGRVIMTEKLEGESGYMLDTHDLPSGLYVIHLVNTRRPYQFRIIKR